VAIFGIYVAVCGAVELTARWHHHCNISVDFSAQTENIFISSILWQCRLV